MIPFFALSLALLLPLQADPAGSASPLEDLPYRPLMEIFSQTLPPEYPDDGVRALRSRIEQQRDQELDQLRETEKQWKKNLAADRRELESLNRASSTDSAQAARRRSDLHIEIAALERGIRDKAFEREHTVPATYELQLARLWLSEHWPRQREKILKAIEEGNGRDRRHGDVEDIGYRKLVKDREKDVEVGEQAARQLMAGGFLPAPLQDEQVQGYVRQLALRIATHSDLKVPLHLTVLDSTDIRAIALPGGFLYLTSGLIRATQTESELAGVLSREIARIAARHATRTSKGAWISRLFVPVTQVVAGVFTGGATSAGAYYGLGYGVEGAGSLLNRVLTGSSKGRQIEADQLGIQYAWKAGFDPKGFVLFVDSLGPEKRTSFLAPEPSLEKRLLNLFAEIQFLAPESASINDSREFEKIKQRLKL